MGQFFAKDYTGAAFQIFGLEHLMALGLIAIVNIGFAYRRGNSTPQSSRAFRYGLAAVLLVNELGWHLWHLFTGQWTIQTMLPLHLCSVMVFLSAFMLITKNYTLYEYLYFLGIGGAFRAVLTPDLGLYGT
ncbi:MAG: TIGR02206 family membrane protein [Chloroflexi bacterium]|nr:TIGR02206 family membrane protein [Chloroflexota bacterium]